MTKKQFKEYLNEKYTDLPHWHNYQYYQRIRKYGDYLYSQDNAQFDNYFEFYQKYGDNWEKHL